MLLLEGPATTDAWSGHAMARSNRPSLRPAEDSRPSSPHLEASAVDHGQRSLHVRLHSRRRCCSERRHWQATEILFEHAADLLVVLPEICITHGHVADHFSPDATFEEDAYVRLLLVLLDTFICT